MLESPAFAFSDALTTSIGVLADANTCTRTCCHESAGQPSREKAEHKDIGTLYLIFAAFSGILGTCFSMIIRIEVAQLV